MAFLAAYKNRGHAFHEEIDKKRTTKTRLFLLILMF
jgi:hypothetical protein